MAGRGLAAARVAVVLLVLVACKRPDARERPPENHGAGGAWGGSGDEKAAPAADDRVVVPAGSLVASTIEHWYAVLLPKPASARTLGKLADEARALGFEIGGDPSSRWLEVDTSSPADAGYMDGEVLLRIDPADEAKLKVVTAAILIGAGGPAAELDAIHAGLIALSRRAAAEGHGWILDDQTSIAFDLAALDAGPARSARDASELVTLYNLDDDDGLRAVQTAGMNRFGLPELRFRRVPSGMLDALGTTAPEVTAQALIDHGGLLMNGLLEVDLAVLVGYEELMELIRADGGSGTISWNVTWADVGDDEPPVLELDAVGIGDPTARLGAALQAFYGVTLDEEIDIDVTTPAALAAVKRARAELAMLREHFEAGVPANETLWVIAPFERTKGRPYFLWLEVIRWRAGTRLEAIVVNTPPPGLEVALGQHVEIPIAEVVDYVHARADGTEAGRLQVFSAE